MGTSTLVELGSLTVHNLEQVKLLNSVVLPVKFSKKVYDELLEVDEFAKMAFFDKIFVGAVCCRFEPVIEGSSDSAQRKLYILSLAVLAPYRRRGVASYLIDHVLKHARLDKTVESIYLHVQTTNEDAIKFYEGQGFKRGALVENYYANVDKSSPHALVLAYRLV